MSQKRQFLTKNSSEDSTVRAPSKPTPIVQAPAVQKTQPLTRQVVKKAVSQPVRKQPVAAPGTKRLVNNRQPLKQPARQVSAPSKKQERFRAEQAVKTAVSASKNAFVQRFKSSNSRKLVRESGKQTGKFFVNACGGDCGGCSICGSDCDPITFDGCYDDVYLDCNPTPDEIEIALGTGDDVLVTTSSVCPGDLVIAQGGVVTLPEVKNGCSSSQTRFFIVQDSCGNTAMISRTVCWVTDTEPPVLTFVNAGLLLAIEDPPGSNTWYIDYGCNKTMDQVQALLASIVITASDNCACDEVIPTYDDVQSLSSCQNVITRTYTAVDGCNNSSTLTITISWYDDTMAPVITLQPYDPGYGCPPDSYTTNLGCWSSANPPSDQLIDCALGDAVAVDGCSDNVVLTVIQNPAPGPFTRDPGNDCGMSVTRVWKAVDRCGNEVTVSRTVSWSEDTTPPTITIVSTCESDPCDLGCNPCDADIDAALGYAQAASDNCTTVTFSCSDGPILTPDPVNAPCRRQQTRSWVVKDACGNEADASRTVTWTVNTTAPVISVAPYNSGDVIEMDHCNPTDIEILSIFPTPSAGSACLDQIVVTQVGDDEFFYAGCKTYRKRTWTATDGCGNTSFANLTVAYTIQEQAPYFISVGAPQGVQDQNGNYDVILNICNACDSQIDGALGSALLVNPCGDASSCDGGGCNGGCDYGCDAIDSDITADPNGPFGPCGLVQTRTWTAVDPCSGATITHTRTVHWRDDQQGPQFDPVPQTKTIGCCDQVVFDAPTATDPCSGRVLKLTFQDIRQNAPLGAVVHTRTWYATDDCGITSSIAQSITVTACEPRQGCRNPVSLAQKDGKFKANAPAAGGCKSCQKKTVPPEQQPVARPKTQKPAPASVRRGGVRK